MAAVEVADTAEDIVVVVAEAVAEVSLRYSIPVVPSADGTNKGGRW
jgi:hypothetical protein